MGEFVVAIGSVSRRRRPLVEPSRLNHFDSKLLYRFVQRHLSPRHPINARETMSHFVRPGAAVPPQCDSTWQNQPVH
ncbi:hypothetical protein C9427_24915 [Mesorhizobium helmanticense]|uniref:Uncharacterized protein n=1 Tax=Mesorhizobium helmanticense TaxID=1776423 RepID=A0A2T4IPZ1_9HYPH|nr:hypothetical protein C9427_24915 [Mesorhizobium helmanticense]